MTIALPTALLQKSWAQVTSAASNLNHHVQGGDMENPFKWRHFQPAIILLAVRWYWRYSLSSRDLEEMMTERGLSLDHTTIYRCVQRYAPEIDRRSRPYLKQTNDSWRVDETYVKVRGNMKRKIKPGLGYFSYPTAWRTVQGYEAMHMIRKGQIKGATKGNIQAQNKFIAGLFGLVA
jgi:transposase-like protein